MLGGRLLCQVGRCCSWHPCFHHHRELSNQGAVLLHLCLGRLLLLLWLGCLTLSTAHAIISPCRLQDFESIAQHLPGRTVAECVVFFYKHQKLEEFSAVRRKQQLKKRRQNAEQKRHMIAPLLVRAENTRSRGGGVRGAGGRGRGRGRRGDQGAEEAAAELV